MSTERDLRPTAAACWVLLALLLSCTAGVYVTGRMFLYTDGDNLRAWSLVRPLILARLLTDLFVGIPPIGLLVVLGLGQRVGARVAGRTSRRAHPGLWLLTALGVITLLEATGALARVVPAVAAGPVAGVLCLAAIAWAAVAARARRAEQRWRSRGFTLAHGLIAGACLLAGVWMVFWAHGRWPHVSSAPFLVAGLSLLVLERIARVPAPQEGKPIGPSGSWSGRISQAQGTALGAVLLLLSCVGFLMTPGTVAWRWSSVRAAEEFHEAVEKGQLNRLDELLAENPGALRAFELMGHDLLSWAAVNDQAEVARLLLQWDADPNAVSILGKRPLHCAAMRGSADVTALLLEEGADPNVRDFCGTTPLFDAAVEGHRGCRELLLENGARHDLLSAAAAGDVLALVRVLPLADLDARDLRGRTALHVSAASGHAVVVDALLDSGADIAAEDRWDRTPLMAAARNGRSEIADILLRRGADPDAADEKGMTALHSAAERGDAVTARLLLNAGASPNPVAENGLTPMFLAVGEGHDAIADLLEVHGVRKVARVIRVGP